MTTLFIAPQFTFVKDLDSRPMIYKIFLPQKKTAGQNSLEGDLIKGHSKNIMLIFKYIPEKNCYVYDGVEIR